jgi:transcriptional regulator with XRE-family HTH domain
MTFGKIIAKMRQEKGLSQKQLATLIKKEDGHPISAPYLNDIEHDRRSPSSDRIIQQFAQALGIEPEVLYFATRRIPPYFYETTPASDKLIIAALRAGQKVLQRGKAIS